MTSSSFSHRLVLVSLVLAAAASACESKGTSKKALPAAKDWQAPAVGSAAPGPSVGRTAPSDPHAGVPGAPPLGNSGGGDPHAGVPGAPPLGNGGGGDPHAGVPGAPPLGDDLATDPPGGLDLPPPDPSRAVDESKFLAGTVTVPPALQAKIPVGAAIFLSVRPGGAGGMPMAVDKLTATGTWPLSFRITAAKAMVDGTAFTGAVAISARYDQDGEAMRAQPGDLTGAVKASIPADGLVITLDTVQP